MSSPRLLLIAKALPPVLGGIESYSAEVADAYACAGYRVSVLTPGRLDEIGPGARVDRERGEERTRSQWLSAARILKDLWCLQSKRWDFIHATSWRMAVPVMLMTFRRRLVITVHGREVTGQNGFMRRLAQWVLSRAELLVYVSAATRAEVEDAIPKLAASRSVVAWNGVSTGVDLAVRQKCDDGVVRLLSVSRLVKRKNIPFAVSAVAELYRRLQGKVVFTITGTGPELSEIEAAVKREQLPADVVRLVGRVDDARLSTLYREADIFFHPQCSRHDRGDIEGFGISIIDAMAYGVPVVCGRDGGPSEYVESGVNGYLVKGDDLGEAVSLLEDLALNPVHRSKIADEARNLVKREMTWIGHVGKIVESISP